MIPPLPLSQTACSGELIADKTSGEDSVPLEAWCCRYLYLAALTPLCPGEGFSHTNLLLMELGPQLVLS